jgi:tripartite-type tricarboxylate transporter receptor subunit TctC
LILSGMGYSAWGQYSYPKGPIELVVPFGAGGATDLSARIISEFVSREWKQLVNVVNKPGGTAAIGTVYVLQAKPDGYIMLLQGISGGTLNPAMQTKLPYKWDDPTLIGRTNSNPIIFCVKGDSPCKTLKELGDTIKKDPSKFSFSTGAAGGPSTFTPGQFLKKLGVRIKGEGVGMVVFDSGRLSANAVAGGHTIFCAQNLSEVLGMLQSGHLRALATTTSERLPQLPDVPTAAEAGFPEANMMGWQGLQGPPGLPDEVVKRWIDTMEKLSQNESYIKKMHDTGAVVNWLGPKDFKNFMAKEFADTRALAVELGLRK